MDNNDTTATQRAEDAAAENAGLCLVHKLGCEISAIPDLDDLLDFVLSRLLHVLHCKSGSIFLLDSPGDTTRSRYSGFGKSSDAAYRDGPPSRASPFWSRIFEPTSASARTRRRQAVTAATRFCASR